MDVLSSSPVVPELRVTGTSTRAVNDWLHDQPPGSNVRLVDPRGRHNLAVGLDAELHVEIIGDVGYYVGGLGRVASVVVRGSAGWGAGENLMSGSVRVDGDAGQSTAASAHGGVVVVAGNAGARTGISLKGASVVVAGDVGHAAAFMAQAGVLLVGGDAGDALGDSLYEAVIYVAGRIASLGADAEIVDLDADDIGRVEQLAATAGIDHVTAGDVHKVVSARTLYNFDSLMSHAY